jgi:hypothetical protein
MVQFDANIEEVSRLANRLISARPRRITAVIAWVIRANSTAASEC